MIEPGTGAGVAAWREQDVIDEECRGAPHCRPRAKSGLPWPIHVCAEPHAGRKDAEAEQSDNRIVKAYVHVLYVVG